MNLKNQKIYKNSEPNARILICFSVFTKLRLTMSATNLNLTKPKLSLAIKIPPACASTGLQNMLIIQNSRAVWNWMRWDELFNDLQVIDAVNQKKQISSRARLKVGREKVSSARWNVKHFQ